MNKKDLLRRDIASRMYSGLICRTIEDFYNPNTNEDLGKLTGVLVGINEKWCNFIDLKDDKPFSAEFTDFKPILRPMNTMSKEEQAKFNSFDSVMNHDPLGQIDWLIENHFDFRDFIGQDMAIAAVGDDNVYEKYSLE